MVKAWPFSFLNLLTKTFHNVIVFTHSTISEKYIMKAWHYRLFNAVVVSIFVLVCLYIYTSQPKVIPINAQLASIMEPAKTSPMIVEIDSKEWECLTENIFFEARGESEKGKEMVGLVTMNRLHSPHFPSSICGVVFQYSVVKVHHKFEPVCQFSWACQKNLKVNVNSAVEQKEWLVSAGVARKILLDQIQDNLIGVTHYHADYVHPNWAKSKNYQLVAVVGKHMFYRWKMAMIPSKNEVAMN
jgi:hypothetical protein